MLYTKREQLTIYELKNNEEYISIDDLKNVILEKPSNIIYCEKKEKLVGLISMGDILRAMQKDQDRVIVNKKYTSLYQGEYFRAKEIFKKQKHINALPVITTDHVLIGDYTRWDDLLVLDYLIETDKGRSIENWKSRPNMILVRPSQLSGDRQKTFTKFKEYLTLQNVTVRCIEHSEVLEYLEKSDFILFIDQNEMRACRTRLNIILGENHDGCEKLITLKRILEKNIIENDINFDDKKCISYLKNLRDKGIKILGLVFNDSIYYKKLLEKIEKRFIAVGEVPSVKLPEAMYKDFFDNLYSKEYADKITNMPFYLENNQGVLCLKDCKSQYCNITNAERNTINQPDKYKKSIYFFGQCYIYGHYVEDKYTIESLLQERLNRNGDKVRVVNCGSLGTNIEYRYLTRIAATQLKKGDMIVIDRPPKDLSWIYYLDLNRVLEENRVGPEWLVDSSFHCNHKVNKFYADAIYETLVPILHEEVDGQRELVEKEDDFVNFLYLNRYFTNFESSKYHEIGSIVMNCNPFTLGHRYLIEQALKLLDFLIIFIVEEDKSAFSFLERFAMVREGVADLNNVKVVPSGSFILSKMTFPEYFIKEKSKDIIENTENDIKVFAEKIAPRLGIKYRIVGEEPLDEITKQYNVAMEKVLPHYGINTVIIPRKTVNGNVISASLVRKCLTERKNEILNELLPETTKRILGLG